MKECSETNCAVCDEVSRNTDFIEVFFQSGKVIKSSYVVCTIGDEFFTPYICSTCRSDFYICVKCKKSALIGVSFYSERAKHMLSHYNLQLSTYYSRQNFLQDVGKKYAQWLAPPVMVSETIPQMMLLEPVIDNEELDELLYNSVEDDYIFNACKNREQVYINIALHLYRAVIKYLTGCVFECSTCHDVYDSLPTLEVVMAHCDKMHASPQYGSVRTYFSTNKLPNRR